MVVALLLLSAATADHLELLGPTGFVSPDGFEVAVRRAGDRSQPAPDAKLTVEGADATKTDRGFVVVPRTGIRKIRLKAQAGTLSVEATYEVGPPAARISLQLVG